MSDTQANMEGALAAKRAKLAELRQRRIERAKKRDAEKQRLDQERKRRRDSFSSTLPSVGSGADDTNGSNDIGSGSGRGGDIMSSIDDMLNRGKARNADKTGTGSMPAAGSSSSGHIRSSSTRNMEELKSEKASIYNIYPDVTPTYSKESQTEFGVDFKALEEEEEERRTKLQAKLAREREKEQELARQQQIVKDSQDTQRKEREQLTTSQRKEILEGKDFMDFFSR
jgi:hypothetical protein